MEKFQVLIVDLGSQYSLVIGRTLREIGFRSVTLRPDKVAAWLTDNKPKAIIVSGGSKSVSDDDCPVPPEEVLNSEASILGICLGMQWLAKQYGGTVTSDSVQSKEYGPLAIRTEQRTLFLGVSDNQTNVWASHGDSVSVVPKGWSVIARSKQGTIAAIASKHETRIGLQFHPEVSQSIDGKKILSNFLASSGCTPDWNPVDTIENLRTEVRSAAVINGAIGRAVLGLSGGVDSSVVGALLQPVFGENLMCIVIDTGFLREGEIDEIKRTAYELGVQYKIIDAAGRFHHQLGEATEPETKRATFKSIYKSILEEEVADFKADFIIQGSLATDFIESGKAGESALIKSHHNIGIDWKISELHPLRRLFKYEVREIGETLGLSSSITQRQPFPGPGLMVRIIGTPATQQVVSILRTCDGWVRDILQRHDIYDKISQLVVALDGTKTVGVKGDGRVYGYSIILRPVVTHDFMTCSVYEIPFNVIMEIMSKVTQHPEVTRLFYDYTTKPPGTTEME
jgi:GMP synthase (glutamine-hydrolysing)